MLKRIGTIVMTIAIPICVLLTTIQCVVMWDGFYENHYEDNGVVDATKIEMDQLMDITDEIQDYLFGRRDDFRIRGVVDGEEGQVFNEREITHMKDVQDLFERGMILRNGSALLIVIFGVYLLKREKSYLYKAMTYSAIGSTTLGVVLALMLSQNFNKYFNIFHKIFFQNDYWILDPEHSVLINMVNSQFFMNIVALILGISLVLIVLIGLLGARLERKRKEGMNH